MNEWKVYFKCISYHSISTKFQCYMISGGLNSNTKGGEGGLVKFVYLLCLPK